MKISEADRELLRAYAAHDMNRERTSKAVFLHSNSIRYRFDVIREKTGLDPGRFYDLEKLLGLGDEMKEEAMQIKINTHGNPLPESHGEWVDLASAEDVELGYGEFKIISLGVSMELPEGYYAHVVPRSSTFKKWGVLLANSMGVIENDYCGDNDVWGFPALCMRKEGVKIPKGTRLCQFRLEKKAPDIEFVQVEDLGNPDRGGYGSTGEGAGK